MSPAPADTAKSKSRLDPLTSHDVDRATADTLKVNEKAPSSPETPESVTSKPHLASERPTAKNTTSNLPHLDESAPPLPDEEPPLPDEAPPIQIPEDDGWAPVWEESSQAFYFYNRFTHATQWTNPRVPDATVLPATAPGVPAPQLSAPGTVPQGVLEPPLPARPAGGYDPAVHGDYDPEAWYAQDEAPQAPTLALGVSDPAALDPTAAYGATGAFNRFTGRWQAAELGPEMHNDENKSKRQMNAFFDVDAAANSHDGRSLKAERSGKKLSRSEVKGFKEKRKAKKEEKRRAWLRD